MASTNKKKSTAATASPASGNGGGGDDAVHTETTVTMMSFANPPSAAQSSATVAQACAKSGFSSIGIAVSSSAQIIDFSLIDDGMCQTLASSLEVCVDAGTFSVPALAGTFMIMQQKSAQITFANFITGLTQLMSPKS
jgi:hypothetical protein